MLKKYIATVFLSTLCFSVNADSVRWNLYFYDSSDNKIGAGNFSYNPATRDRFYDIGSSGFQYDYTFDTLLTHFYAKVRGLEVTMSGDAWVKPIWKDDIGDETYGSGMLIQTWHDPYPRFLDGLWVVEVPGGPLETSVMNLDTVETVFATGTYTFLYPDDRGNESGCYCDYGTWVAVRTTP